jgi:radical SAM-linked protein
MSIAGDLRFASHHDTMRAVERLLSRAKLPVAFSQGFNPRPVLSLSVPRPVGVASQDDRVVLKLDAPLEPAHMLDALNRHAPEGMAFEAACEIAARSLTPQRVAYQARLAPQDALRVRQRIDKLQTQDTWPVERLVKSRRRRGRKKNDDSPRTKTLDLRPRIARLEIDGETLQFETICSSAAEARPVDILDLLGLPPRETLARLVRRRITDDTTPPAKMPSGPDTGKVM